MKPKQGLNIFLLPDKKSQRTNTNKKVSHEIVSNLNCYHVPIKVFIATIKSILKCANLIQP